MEKTYNQLAEEMYNMTFSVILFFLIVLGVISIIYSIYLFKNKVPNLGFRYLGIGTCIITTYPCTAILNSIINNINVLGSLDIRTLIMFIIVTLTFVSGIVMFLRSHKIDADEFKDEKNIKFDK